MQSTEATHEGQVVANFLTSPGENTFAALFRILAPQLVSFFRVRRCESALAEDLTQEVMLSVFRQGHTLRDREFFRAWVFRIARNALLQHQRREGRQVQTTGLTPGVHETRGATMDPLAGSRFAEWMSVLSDEESQMMMFRYVEGLEYHEIATVLSIPQGTVQWKLHSCRKKLAVFWKEGSIG
ncbi:MAG: RNA polymerase sigma factor [Bryobacteraceae bacterium]|nr:RNA polymerase sigma factor [Bryobacteraceae bacterium]